MQHQLGIPQKHRTSTDGSRPEIDQWANQLRSDILDKLKMAYPNLPNVEYNRMLSRIGAWISMSITQTANIRNQSAIQFAPLAPQDIGVHPDAPNIENLSLMPQAAGFSNVAPMTMPTKQPAIDTTVDIKGVPIGTDMTDMVAKPTKQPKPPISVG